MSVVVIRDVFFAVAGSESMQIELAAVDLLWRWLPLSASLCREEFSNRVGLLASAAVGEVRVDCIADFAVLE